MGQTTFANAVPVSAQQLQVVQVSGMHSWAMLSRTEIDALAQVTAEIERSGEAFEKAALLDLQQAYDRSLDKAKKEISKVVHGSLRQLRTESGEMRRRNSWLCLLGCLCCGRCCHLGVRYAAI